MKKLKEFLWLVWPFMIHEGKLQWVWIGPVSAYKIAFYKSVEAKYYSVDTVSTDLEAEPHTLSEIEVTKKSLTLAIRELNDSFNPDNLEPPDASLMVRDALRNVPNDMRPLFYNIHGTPVFNSRERVDRYVKFHEEHELNDANK